MKKIVILLLLISLFLFQQNAFAVDISAEKKVLVDRVLLQTGQSAIAVGKQFSDLFIQQMTSVLKQSNPNINPRAFEIIEEEITDLINEEFVINSSLSKIMYPIYDRHLSIEDLKKMIELNDTPFGKKLIKLMPLITQESMQAGQALGQSLAPKIQDRIVSRFEKEGIQ